MAQRNTTWKDHAALPLKWAGQGRAEEGPFSLNHLGSHNLEGNRQFHRVWIRNVCHWICLLWKPIGNAWYPSPSLHCWWCSWMINTQAPLRLEVYTRDLKAPCPPVICLGQYLSKWYIPFPLFPFACLGVKSRRKGKPLRNNGCEFKYS